MWYIPRVLTLIWVRINSKLNSKSKTVKSNIKWVIKWFNNKNLFPKEMSNTLLWMRVESVLMSFTGIINTFSLNSIELEPSLYLIGKTAIKYLLRGELNWFYSLVFRQLAKKFTSGLDFCSHFLINGFGVSPLQREVHSVFHHWLDCWQLCLFSQ